jgi:hypothetical protein
MVLPKTNKAVLERGTPCHRRDAGVCLSIELCDKREPASPGASRAAGRSGQSHARAKGLVTVTELASWLQVEPSFVYSHAAELGVVRLGTARRRVFASTSDFPLSRRVTLSEGSSLGVYRGSP